MEGETTAITTLEPDWNAIQERYLEGEELGSIAADHNTTPKAIAQRAWRYHWKAQQFKLVEARRGEIEKEVRGCIVVSVLKEARAFQREDPSPIAAERDTFSKARERLYNLAARVFGWERDPLDSAKSAKCLDV